MAPFLDRVEDWLLHNRANLFRLPESQPGFPAASGKLAYLAGAVAHGGVLFHGSNHVDIATFEPRDQNTAHDRPVRAVFATPDPIWAMFFAVVDRAAAHSLWNACVAPEESGLQRTRYFFSVGCDPRDAWTSGAVYLLPRETFVRGDSANEWISEEAVDPVGVLKVTPDDFPFARHVFRHRRGESDWRRLARLAATAARAPRVVVPD